MQIGVIIENGPRNWQIIQQKDGSADINMAGRWVEPEPPVQARVFVRLVREDTGESIVSWTECEHPEKYRWQVTLKNVPAGGLYRIETCLNNESNLWNIEWATRGDMIHHIGVGDIFVITGQSNSAGYGKDPVYDPPEIGVHLLRNNGVWDLASHPMNESTDTLHEVNRETANPGHSPYLSFARMLKRELGYPIGLIQASLGGSPLSRWNPGESGDLYASMMKTVKSQGETVKGILWYQGCSDANAAECLTYLDRFENMVRCLRKDLKNEELPVLTVQLNRCIGTFDETADNSWGMVREVQRQAVKRITNVFVIPAIDCTLTDLIHNSSASNMVLGERLARMALTGIYGKKGFLGLAPDLAAAEKLGEDKILLTFDNVYNRILFIDNDVKGLPFTVKDEEGIVPLKSFELKDRNGILLTLERTLKGKGLVHGAYEVNPKFIVPMDTESHLPMLSFFGIEIV